ncbi:hypothetical protein [Rhodococcus sp. NBC_00297]|uniref:hypothetical protein n=1 Tax=Rhodococcus sp. NBC_00297 TaxID=2976005 RepID=UPI002E27FECC|nr:hypothetical protein [Rhodococcus sp. NBC_00297]
MDEIDRRVTEEDVEAKWAEISPLIERVTVRIGTPSEFPVGSTSSLAGDDAASAPYQVSHCVRMCMTAGVDHLHAVKKLVVDSGFLHVAAPFSLSRGALESFAAAFWILDPPTRDVRVERVLRWNAKNFRDGERAYGRLGVAGRRSLESKLAKLQRVADARGITERVTGGFTSTEALVHTEENSGLKVMFPWQLCSGFAHGRPWAYLGVSDIERYGTADPGVHDLQLTSNRSTVLYPALEALHLLQVLLRVYERRANLALDRLS